MNKLMASFVLCHWLTPVRSAELPVDLLATFKQPEDNVHYLKIAVAHDTSTVFLTYPPKFYYFIKWKVDHLKINLYQSFLCIVFSFWQCFRMFVSVMLQVLKLYEKLQILLFNTLAMWKRWSGNSNFLPFINNSWSSCKNISIVAGSQMPLW